MQSNPQQMFNDVYYKQVDRVAMWSPLGPTLANLFLVYHKNKWLENCLPQFNSIYFNRPQFYRIYVDDLFVTFRKKNHIKKFLRNINSHHRNIKFICDEENHNKISFLDISISRNNNELETCIFCKRIFSGVYTTFNSFLPTEYKRGLLYTFLYRTYNIVPAIFRFMKKLII